MTHKAERHSSELWLQICGTLRAFSLKVLPAPPGTNTESQALL